MAGEEAGVTRAASGWEGSAEVAFDDWHMAPGGTGRTSSVNMARGMRDTGAQLHRMSRPGVEDKVEAGRPRVRVTGRTAASN